MSNGDKEIDPEASLKLLRVLSALSMAADTHKNVLFAGEKGREKYKNTNFGDLKSIEDNAVEGTDIAENFGMTPGKASTYAVGQGLDLLNPMTIAISAASKGGKALGTLAKILSPMETVLEEGGKKVVKNALPKYLKQEMVHTKDFPHAEAMAEEAIKTGVSKKLGNPEKALTILKGKKESKVVGGSTDLPIREVDKSKGTMDEVGEQLSNTVERESKNLPKVNKARIFREELDKIKAKNAKGVDYKLDEGSQEKILRDAISPSEMRTVSIPNEVKPVEEIADEISTLEDLIARKKEARDAKYFTSPDEPPPVPRDVPPPVKATEYDNMGLESLLAETANKKKAKAQAEVVKKSPPTTMDIPVESEATVKELWDKKVALRKQFKESTHGKPMSEWSDKEKALEGIIDNIDERIQKMMSIPGAEEYAGLNQKYGSQAKLAQIFEDQLQSKSGSTAGNVARGGAEVAAGGVGNPGTIGRATKGVVNAITGPKRRVQFGNAMQDRRLTTPLSELMSEAVEVPYDHPYLEDNTPRTEESEVDFSAVPEHVSEEPQVDFSAVPEHPPGRHPQSVEEIPGAGDATDIMAPQEPVHEDPIHQKMDHVLDPGKPLWDPYVNEEVLNTFLPRDSKRIMENPQALMAKVQQVAPNQVAVVQEMLDNDPEGMVEAGPKIAMMFPTIFEKDKYGAFDGKIIDPQMQQKFLSDLSQDEEMDAIEKSRLAMKVQRGESIHS